MKKQSARVPTSSTAKRLAGIMHRRETSLWNEKKEIDPFRRMSKTVQDEDLTLVERYYANNWPPRTGHNHLRHDLATLINNWEGEVDRARAWCDGHRLKPPPARKIIPLPPPPETQMTPAERADWEIEFTKLMGRAPKI